MSSQWKFELFGHLQLQAGDVIHTRFYSQKVASLLARLACFPRRQFGREEIIDLYWPESDLRAGRVNLRTALASLRRQLEPPGVQFGTVLNADYTHIGLNPAAVTTDVAQFEEAIAHAKRANSLSERTAALQSAYRLYRGELLPGLYDDWVLIERDRLAAQFRTVTVQLQDTAIRAGELTAALDYSWRRVASETVDEQAHLTLLELLVKTGQLQVAQQQYQHLWALCRQHFEEPPSKAVCERARQLGLVDPAAQCPTGKLLPGHRVSSSHASAPMAPERDPASRAPVTTSSSLDARNLELPLTLTRFFGRDAEVSALCDWLRSCHSRLLTLTGAGGIGKTRLAIEAARAYAAEFTGRIVFVPLADVVGTDGIPAHLLNAFRLSADGKTTPLAQLIAALRDTPTLLILDNFEHLIPGGAAFVLELLASAPSLRCLVASRQRLDVAGEQVFPLEPLPCPESDAGLEALSRCPSAQLLVDRVRAVRPDFQVTVRNSAALAAVCRRLEGLPLALELAAARIQVMTVGQMQVELEHRLEFLVSRRRKTGPRHHSLRATLDWSCQLLRAEQQRFLACMTVFRGGWTAEAAQAICQAEDLSAVNGASGDTLSRLEELHACSLIHAEECDENMRFRMLEMVREYAQEKRCAPEENNDLEDRHRQYFTRLAEEGETAIHKDCDTRRYLDRLDAEHDNFRQALAFCRDNGLIEAGLRLSSALVRFWIARGYQVEGSAWLTHFLDRDIDGRPTLHRARALIAMASCSSEAGQYEQAVLLCEQALLIAERNRSVGTIAYAYHTMGYALRRKGMLDLAHEAFRKSVTYYRQDQDEFGVTLTLTGTANLYRDQGDTASCLPLYDESIALARRLKSRTRLALALVGLAITYHHLENYEAAHDLYEEALQINRELGDTRNIAYSLLGLGVVSRNLRAWPKCLAALTDSLKMFRSLRNHFMEASALFYLGDAQCAFNDLTGAEQSLCDCLSLWKQNSSCLHEGILNCLEVRAYVWARQQKWAQAARLIGSAYSLRASSSFPYLSRLVVIRDRERDQIRLHLSEADWNRCWTDGEAMTWQQAITYALTRA